MPVFTESLILWGGALVLVAAIFLPYALSFRGRNRKDRARKEEAVQLGIDRPKAQFPAIDAARCIGCGTCVSACPEHDVLGIVGGRATVINGLRCVGHGKCQDACPVGAIQVGLGDLKSRDDIPLTDEWGESSVPGLFLVGEIAGLALVKNAVAQGPRAVERIAQRIAKLRSGGGDAFDLVVVGSGPAGLSAAAAAKGAGLSCVVLDQEKDLGGTIFHYPRRKLVLVQPIELPGWGRMKEGEYSKEELLVILKDMSQRQGLRVRFGERVESVTQAGGLFSVKTATQVVLGRTVILALGRRGSPRKLGVPGEERPKVLYQLLDAESYRNQQILVVGGGDTAVEAILGLARQSGNRVTLSYRRDKLVRIKRNNAERMEALIAAGTVKPLFGSEVDEVLEGRVRLRLGGKSIEVRNDLVFVFAGGEPPFALLKQCGVRFGGEPQAVERSALGLAPRSSRLT